MPPISCIHMNHINAAVDDFDDSVAHFRDIYGAQLISDMPKDEWHACLITMGGVIFELFAPHDDLLHARFGPHYVGVEYQIPDVEQARPLVEAAGVRIVRELGAAFHVHPLDACGVALEFFDLSFHADPPWMPFLEAPRPAGWWRDEHPLGICGLARYSVVADEMEETSAFFQTFVSGRVAYEAERPAIGAKAVGLELGDTVVELLSPADPGRDAHRLLRYGPGIRSVVWRVASLERARAHFAAFGIDLGPGDADDSLAVPLAANQGLRFEFVE